MVTCTSKLEQEAVSACPVRQATVHTSEQSVSSDKRVELTSNSAAARTLRRSCLKSGVLLRRADRHHH